MSLDELREWEAFYQLEPWGSPAEDDRWRLNYDLIFGAHYKPAEEPVIWLDRDPEETARIRERDREANMESRLEAFFLGHGVVEADQEDDSAS